MSAAALWTHDGSGANWTVVNDLIAKLPRDLRGSADATWKAIVGFLDPGETDLTIKNAALLTSKWLTDFSQSYLSKGLATLEHILGVIDRETRSNRRKISFTEAALLKGTVRESAVTTEESPKESPPPPPTAALRNVNLPGPKAARLLLEELRANGWDLEVLEGAMLRKIRTREDARDLPEGTDARLRIHKSHLLDLISAIRPARE